MTCATFCQCSPGCCLSAELLCSPALLLIQCCVLGQPRRTLSFSGSCRRRGGSFQQGSKGGSRSPRLVSACYFLILSLGSSTDTYLILWGWWETGEGSSQVLETDAVSLQKCSSCVPRAYKLKLQIGNVLRVNT